MITTELIKNIENGGYDSRLQLLYSNVAESRQRYINAVCEFEKLYGIKDCELFSVSGRSEILGNHTDHNKGCVLAASVSVDIIAVASKTDDNVVRVKSEGFDEDVCDLSVLSVCPQEKGKSISLIRGMCDSFNEKGLEIGGFCAYTTSSVAKGSGLSSSAAFEDMIGNILSHLYNGGNVSTTDIAIMAQRAENVYYGKPCGLMDQVACANGGFVFIDFETTPPVIEKIEFAPEKYGYDMCIVNTFASHAGLDEDYAAMPVEMKSVAKFFGGEVLRDIDRNEFYKNIEKARKACGDRAVLRAIHFYNECDRVQKMKQALKNGDMQTFLDCENASCDSSEKYLQNIYTCHNSKEQSVALALCVSREFLKGEKYSARVHGGGFAGTIQIFLPSHLTESYSEYMDGIFGKDACKVLKIRQHGAVKL